MPARDRIPGPWRYGSDPGRLVDMLAYASLMFLGLLAVGASLVLAAKLEFPRLGSDSHPLSVLVAIVITALASMGVTIHVGGLEIVALPLGAMVTLWVLVRWLMGHFGVQARTPAEHFRHGIGAGLLFGVVCWAAALLFRFDGPDAANAGAGEALLLGWLWGSIYCTLGSLSSGLPLRTYGLALLKLIERRSKIVREGLLSGVMTMVLMAFLSAAAVLLWIIVALLRAPTLVGSGVGDAGAALVYLAAFGPNLVVSIASLSLGAPVRAGARLTLAGREVGALHAYSLFEWRGEGTPWYVFTLLLIPVLSSLGAGLYARRNAQGKGRILEVIGIAAVSVGVVLLVLAVLSRARLGAGLLPGRGLVYAAPDPLPTAVLACGLTAVMGVVGWKLGERFPRFVGLTRGAGEPF